MALKLLTTLTVMILACFAYKVWEKTKVPADVDQADVWKVKTIDFCVKIIGRLIALLDYFSYDIHYLRPLFSSTLKILHSGPWLLSYFYRHLNDTDVIAYTKDIAGIQTLIYENIRYRNDSSKAVLIYFHGGGWEWFDAEDPAPTLNALSRELGILTVSVNYRLAPEHVFPAAYHDCLNVTQYIVDHPKEFGIDFRKVIVTGDSAGGNLAAGVAQDMKKKLRMQILIYPQLQAFDFQTPSYRENAKVLKHILAPDMTVTSTIKYGGMNLKHKKAFLDNKHLPQVVRTLQYRSYVNTQLIPSNMNITNGSSAEISTAVNNSISKEVSQKLLDPNFMPFMADSLDNVTDAYIITAQHDILRDEGIMYGKRLQKCSNVKVSIHNYKGAFHTFFHFSSGPLQLSSASQALSDLIQFLRREIYPNVKS